MNPGGFGAFHCSFPAGCMVAGKKRISQCPPLLSGQIHITMKPIRYLEGKEIDKVKWNSCVHYAGNGNIFGYMWYLDFVGKHWDGLVEGDYESVFPLVWREGFFRRRELYQPELMREMGIYSIHVLSHARIRRFLQAIPEEFRSVDIFLNEQNQPPADAGFEVEEFTNHQLLLNKPYEILEDQFSEELKQQLETAESAGIVTTTSLKPETVADFYRRNSKDRHRDRNFHTLQRIMYNVLHRGWGYASGAHLPDGELVAINFYIYSHGKVLSLVPLQSPSGAEVHALPFLFNMLIRSHANRPLVLDFNTADDSMLARRFGAMPNKYYRIIRNKRFLGIW